MGEFVRILKISSKTLYVPLQLLQTMSIMIQNLESEHSICKLHYDIAAHFQSSDFSGLSDMFLFGNCADYMFSNEHVNYLITYPFDFRNEELLSYYISFLRFAL